MLSFDIFSFPRPALCLAALLGVFALPGCNTADLQRVSQTTATSKPAIQAYTPISAADMRHQPLAPDLVELAYNPTENALFVAAPDWEDESQSAVLRLDAKTLDVQQRIALAGKGFGVALDEAAQRLYVGQGFNGSISVIDSASNRLIRQIRLMEKVNFEREYEKRGLSEKRRAFLLEQLKKFKVVDDFPYKIRELIVDRRNQRLFLPGLGLGFDSVLFVVDTQTLALEKTIPGFGYNAVGIALDEAGGRLFVSNMRGQIMVVDTATLQIRQTLEVGADQLLNLVYDAASNRLFGVDQGIDRDEWRNNHLERPYRHRSPGHEVFVLDADSGATMARMPAGQVPINLRLDTQRQRLYVTNRGGVREDVGKGSLTIYDTQKYQLLQTVELPPHPNSLALDSKNNVLYVSVKNDGVSKKAGKQEEVVRIELR